MEFTSPLYRTLNGTWGATKLDNQPVTGIVIVVRGASHSSEPVAAPIDTLPVAEASTVPLASISRASTTRLFILN